MKLGIKKFAMIARLVPYQYLWIFLTFLLFACGPDPTEAAVIPPPTYSPTLTPLPLFPTALPKQTIEPTPTSTQTPVPNDPFSSDRLRMVYVEKGNIFVRNGFNPPIQLTISGIDQKPIISDDGEKIVYYRGDGSDTVFSINADGGQEKLIIKSESLPVLGQGKVRALIFVPRTHTLLFNTYLCNPQVALYNASDCAVSIYSVDTDTGEINQLIAGLGGNTMQSRNFEVSPDGKLLSIANLGHVDIYFLYSHSIDIFYQDAILYSRTIPDEYLPHIYWLPDSSGLITVLATDKYNEPATPPHTYAVWRYRLDKDTAVRVSLNAAIMFSSGCSFSISPDRNWIYFMGNEIGDETELPSLYLGNLENGHAQAVEWTWNNDCPIPFSIRWSPDSKYYAFWNVLVPRDKTPSIPINGEFLSWIDAEHYFYQDIEGSTKETRIGEIGGESIDLPDDFRWASTYVILGANREK